MRTGPEDRSSKVLVNQVAVDRRQAQRDSDACSHSRIPSTVRSGGYAILALVDQGVVSATSFLTLAIIAHNCTQADVGFFHLAWTIVSFVRTVQERTLGAPYLTFVHRIDQNPQTLLGSSLVHQGIFGICCAVVLGIASFAIGGVPKLVALSPVFLALVFSIPFILLRDHVRAVCSAHFQYRVALAVDISAAILQVGGVMALAQLGRLTITSVAVLLGAACIFPTIVWLHLRPQPYEIRWDGVLSDWRQNWSYAKWVVAARSIAISGNNSVPWIVLFTMDEASAGAFGIATGLVGLSQMFIMGANNFFQPRTVRSMHEEGVRKMSRTVLDAIVVLGVVLFLGTILFAVAGGPLLGLIYGDQYSVYGSVTFLLSVSMLTVSVSIACGNGLAALGKPKGYLLGELAYCIVSVSGALLLIPRFGLNGAGAALAIGGFAASLVTAAVLCRLILNEQHRVGKERS